MTAASSDHTGAAQSGGKESRRAHHESDDEEEEEEESEEDEEAGEEEEDGEERFSDESDEELRIALQMSLLTAVAKDSSDDSHSSGASLGVPGAPSSADAARPPLPPDSSARRTRSRSASDDLGSRALSDATMPLHIQDGAAPSASSPMTLTAGTSSERTPPSSPQRLIDLIEQALNTPPAGRSVGASTPVNTADDAESSSAN